MRASADGHSLEEEIRQILSDAAAQPRSTPLNLAQAIMDIVDPVGGIDLTFRPGTPAGNRPISTGTGGGAVDRPRYERHLGDS